MYDEKEVVVAKRLYNDYANNHPTIHSNRFFPWEELPAVSKEEWIAKARKRIAYDEDDCC